MLARLKWNQQRSSVHFTWSSCSLSLSLCLPLFHSPSRSVTVKFSWSGLNFMCIYFFAGIFPSLIIYFPCFRKLCFSFLLLSLGFSNIIVVPNGALRHFVANSSATSTWNEFSNWLTYCILGSTQILASQVEVPPAIVSWCCLFAFFVGNHNLNMAEKTFCIYLTFSVLIEISITESKANANNASKLLTWLSFLEHLPKLCINNRKTMEQLANWLCDFGERERESSPGSIYGYW